MALNKYYRNVKGRKLDEEYINEIKDNIKLTKEQAHRRQTENTQHA